MPRSFSQKKQIRGRGRPTGSKNMKKVSSRGAYKPKVKTQMIKRRAPLVETKQRTHSIIAGLNGSGVYLMPEDQNPNDTQYYLTAGDVKQPLNWRPVLNDDAFTYIPLQTYNRMSRGLRDYQMIGDSVMAKWLNVRVEVRFPSGEIISLNPTTVPAITQRNMTIQGNFKSYLILGWVTAPLNAPVSDSSGTQKTVAEVSQTVLADHIKAQLKPYFDDNLDKLSFTPKQTTNIKIEKYVRLKPQLDSAIPSQMVPLSLNTTTESPSLSPAHGSIPNIQKNHSFKINRKLRYDEGLQPSPGVDTENNFPNNSWLPFAMIYNPDFAVANAVPNYTDASPTNPTSRYEFAANERRCQHMFYRWNDQLNYTDS